MKRVLFLCTGNYFRSRFSELLFRDLIAKHQCSDAVEVTSAGLNVTPDSGNVGAMAPEAIQALAERDISVDPAVLPMPHQVERNELDAADVVVAVDEAAHRPMVQAQFPEREQAVRFWTVKDLGEEEGGEEEGGDPISQLERQVQQLFSELVQDTEAEGSSPRALQ